MSHVFNIQHGYWEALIRGCKQALLTEEDYERLSASDNLDDIRSALETTSYGTFMQDVPAPLGVDTFSYCLKQHFADDFRHVRAMGNGVAIEFMDFVAMDKIIDNLIILLQGSMNKKDGKELLAACNPLGWFPEMQVISEMNTSGGYKDLYLTVLTGSKVGPWLGRFLLAKKDAAAAESAGNNAANNNNGPEQTSASNLGSLLENVDIEEMRHALKKYWMEAFDVFCQKKCGGLTAEVMGEILKTEADLRAFAITMNTIPQMEATQDHEQVKIMRDVLFPGIGHLYPEFHLQMRNIDSFESLRNVFGVIPDFEKILDSVDPEVESPEGKNFEDYLYDKVNVMCEMAFTRQMHFAVAYAWVKLKEQEIRNILWICELVLMGRKDGAKGLPMKITF